MGRTRILLLSIILSLPGMAVAAAPSSYRLNPVVAVPSQSIGNLRIGMTSEEVVRSWGPPLARNGNTWRYERPVRARVGFTADRVSQIETWDSAVETNSGVRIGTSLADAIRRIGPQEFVRTKAGRGYWLAYPRIGLGVFIDAAKVAGISVFAVDAVALPRPPTTTEATRPAPAPAPSQSGQPAPEPRLKAELVGVKHKTSGDSAIVSGGITNVSGSLTLTDVAVAVEFPEGAEKRRVRKVVARRLDPGAEASFEFALSTVTEYRVFVDSSPMPSGDILDEVRGSIDWTVYPSRVREALIRGIEANVSISLSKVVGDTRFYLLTATWKFRVGQASRTT